MIVIRHFASQMLAQHGCGVYTVAQKLDAENAVERLERLNHANHALYRELEPVVGSYCPGLAAEPFHVHRYSACQHTH